MLKKITLLMLCSFSGLLWSCGGEPAAAEAPLESKNKATSQP